MLQCHLQLAREGKGREGSSTEPVAKCEQWPSIHSHRGITECFLSSLPLCIYFGVCVCVCVCASARSEHNGRAVKVKGCGWGGGDSLVFVRVCVAFSLLWLTTKIPHCSSLADMAFSFPFELPPPPPISTSTSKPAAAPEVLFSPLVL